MIYINHNRYKINLKKIANNYNNNNNNKMCLVNHNKALY